MKENISLGRRGFIRAAGIAAGGVILAARRNTHLEKVNTIYPPTEIPYQLEDGTQMERVEQGQLVETFPGSEVYMSERGDVVVVNRKNKVRLAGQRIETKYGSITFLMSDSRYQQVIRGLVSSESIDKQEILEDMPEWLLSEPQLYKYFSREIDSLGKIQGFREGNEDFGGYPNFTKSSYKEELVKIMSSLIAIQQQEVDAATVTSSSYEPQPKDIVVIMSRPGNAIPLAQTLPDGLIDPNDENALLFYSKKDLAFPMLKTKSGTFVKTLFLGSGRERPLSGYHVTFFFRDFNSDFVELSLRSITHDAVKAQGVSHSWDFNLYFIQPFSKLFENSELYYCLSADTGRYPVKTYFMGGQPLLDWLKHMRFGMQEIIEVDFEKFSHQPSR